MPTYEYQCPECQQRFDLRQGFTDPPQAECPRCGAQAQRRILAAGIVFKGRGWYSTDHRPSSFDPHRDDAGDTKSEEKSTAKDADAPKVTESAPKTEAAASTAD